MLLELNIKNFAIIDDINVRFTKGLNLLTGETGAGKSIIIEALGIILGGRGTKDLIQNGKEQATLQALFYIEDIEGIEELLDSYGIELDEDNLLIITREISINRPSISRVNGRSITLSVLRDISSRLIDIFAQEEHQSLLNISNHKILVDSFGDKEFKKLKDTIANKYDKYIKIKEEIDNMGIDPVKREREIEFLKFQIDEINEANLSMKDGHDLDDEYGKIANTKELGQGIGSIINSMTSEDYTDSSIIDKINNNISILNSLTRYDSELEEYLNVFKQINFDLLDLNTSLKYYIESIDLDEERLLYLNDRINLVNDLKKKYGNTIEDIFNYKESIESELEDLLNYDSQLIKLKEEMDDLEETLFDLSKKLSYERQKIAKFLESQISEELKQLNMEDILFKIYFEERDILSRDGIDYVEFLIATNKGSELKALSRIVSGGEMSRIMLAFKSILAKYDGIPTMIFDEIDTGISGRTAQVVGEKISKISKNHQVISITHLPQIAALADSHYLISKKQSEDKAITNIERLGYDERVEEMARLLGGVNVTDTTMDHAREMLSMTEKLRQDYN